jgi:hypothetical protein
VVWLSCCNASVKFEISRKSTELWELRTNARAKFRTPRTLSHSRMVTSAFTALSFVKPDYPLPDLAYADREVLRSANGCFHCRLLPSGPTWKPHRDIAHECPSDERRGIPYEGYREVLRSSCLMSYDIILSFSVRHLSRRNRAHSHGYAGA